MTHKVKGIVLRAIKYGETSIIAKVYTDLFGMQSYLIKGVRKATKSSSSKINYFLPGSILEMEVYHNPLKSLQFLKEFEWAYLYKNLFFDVVKNAIAMYMIEMIAQAINEEENNPELFSFFENTFIQTDTEDINQVANYPLTFTLHLAKYLGFQIHGNYNTKTPYLDLQEGVFTTEKPHHSYILEGSLAEITSLLKNLPGIRAPENLPFNRNIRRELLKYYQQFFSLHLEHMKEIKSYHILQTVLE
ncbi:DNA repair protein RecO [Arachidicoccus soli]|uniref:DNA repair protein RecO n=1 Tax=Arachidicoccus soli TaxID=2341117 RepID=A0A386HLW8_9BACT|nr:DNA repair protein RecO [Arachidicoccus soli]AYD46898.1 DNA repair protein RecO [Arachidicoccus soli]